ncbi:hypothetical protein TNCT_267441 [Trichonephila clavata]|uniref:Uncharacterized protein n=1 Tax=Trichonephila clavata TaxID=2740835 RepID=A0A8X6KAY4_TRICU|nr:hypothetical protein TNCT_267441 [Trichonephila clavata]
MCERKFSQDQILDLMLKTKSKETKKTLDDLRIQLFFTVMKQKLKRALEKKKRRRLIRKIVAKLTKDFSRKRINQEEQFPVKIISDSDDSAKPFKPVSNLNSETELESGPSVCVGNL